jgi:hypothetical protein
MLAGVGGARDGDLVGEAGPCHDPGDPVSLEYSIEWLTCVIASRLGEGDGWLAGCCSSSSTCTARARKVASWILTPPGKLTEDSRAALTQITARCEELATTRALVREFAEMLRHRHGEHLEAWAAQAESRPVSELRGFAKRLRKDWAGVTAGSPPPTAPAPSKVTSTASR